MVCLGFTVNVTITNKRDIHMPTYAHVNALTCIEGKCDKQHWGDLTERFRNVYQFRIHFTSHIHVINVLFVCDACKGRYMNFGEYALRMCVLSVVMDLKSGCFGISSWTRCHNVEDNGTESDKDLHSPAEEQNVKGALRKIIFCTNA